MAHGDRRGLGCHGPPLLGVQEPDVPWRHVVQPRAVGFEGPILRVVAGANDVHERQISVENVVN